MRPPRSERRTGRSHCISSGDDVAAGAAAGTAVVAAAAAAAADAYAAAAVASAAAAGAAAADGCSCGFCCCCCCCCCCCRQLTLSKRRYAKLMRSRSEPARLLRPSLSLLRPSLTPPSRRRRCQGRGQPPPLELLPQSCRTSSNCGTPRRTGGPSPHARLGPSLPARLGARASRASAPGGRSLARAGRKSSFA